MGADLLLLLWHAVGRWSFETLGSRKVPQELRKRQKKSAFFLASYEMLLGMAISLPRAWCSCEDTAGSLRSLWIRA